MFRTNRIYIMPSGVGFLFLGIIVVMILTAATYNNNLIFFLGFAMFSVFIVSMLQTHYNLKGVRLEYRGSEEAFEGEDQSVTFELRQKRAKTKTDLLIRTASSLIPVSKPERYHLKPTESTKMIKVCLRATKRGLTALPTIILETYYPLGLFRAWKIFRFEAQLVVYPRPVLHRELQPDPFEEGDDELGLRHSPEGDFGELKPYRAGESYHQIAWKQYARTGDLYSKVHWGEENKHFRIPFPTANINLEDRLRWMSGWVKYAFEEGASFEMVTPTVTVESGRGLDQAKKCWRVLAEFKEAA